TAGSEEREPAAREGRRWIGVEEVGVDARRVSEPRASGAGAVRRVEREEARLELGKSEPAVGTGEVARVEVPFGEARLSPTALVADGDHVDRPVSKRERTLDGFDEASARLGRDGLAIVDDLDRVLVAAIEEDRIIALETNELPIDEEASETLLAKALDLAFELAAPRPHDGSADEHPPTAEALEDLIDDLLRALRSHRAAAARAVRHAKARVEESQMIEDLGDGADGRAPPVPDRP